MKTNHAPVRMPVLHTMALFLSTTCALMSLTHAQVSEISDDDWESMGPDGPGDLVSAMATMGNDLYVAGAFPTVQGKVVNGIARWDGREWFPLGTGLDMFVTYWRGMHIRALAVIGDNLYVGGLWRRAVGCSRMVASGFWPSRRRRGRARSPFLRRRCLVSESSPCLCGHR